VLCGIHSPDKWVKEYLQDKHGFYAIIILPPIVKTKIRHF